MSTLDIICILYQRDDKELLSSKSFHAIFLMFLFVCFLRFRVVKLKSVLKKKKVFFNDCSGRICFHSTYIALLSGIWLHFICITDNKLKFLSQLHTLGVSKHWPFFQETLSPTHSSYTLSVQPSMCISCKRVATPTCHACILWEITFFAPQAAYKLWTHDFCARSYTKLCQRTSNCGSQEGHWNHMKLPKHTHLSL